MSDSSPPQDPTPSHPPEAPELLDAEGEREDAAPLAPWPPPGLERLQGDLWHVVDRLAAGGVVLMVPLLATLTLSNDLWRTGIYGDAWWILLITSAAGTLVAGAGYVALFRSLGRWRTAVGRGYGHWTVALALTDRPGDTGFLLQGARFCSMIPEHVRQGLLTGRIFQASLMIAVAAWLSAGFVAGLFLAARGVLQPGELAVWSLGPPVIGVIPVILVRALEKRELRAARKKWFARSWAADLVRDDIRGWHESVARRPEAVPVPAASPRERGRSLPVSRATVAVVALAVLFLVAPLVTVSGVGPILAEVAMPTFTATLERSARSQALVHLRVPVDGTVTPLEAGEALYAVAGPREGAGAELMRPPPRTHPPVFPGDEYVDNPTGMEAGRWARDLMPRARELEPATVAWLEGLGRHPALAELQTVARAGALDELGAIYRLPLPEDLRWHQLPIPRFQGTRELAYAQVGAAVADVARGRVESGEERLRTLISAGVLLGQEGQYLITNLIGHVIAGTGAEALAGLYETTGRADQAQGLRRGMEAAERGAEIGAAGRGARTMDQMPDLIRDTTLMRGLRWEHLTILSGLGPCLNLKRVVFGPPEAYSTWLAETRSSLVRYESEEALFGILVRGWQEGADPGPLGRLFTQTMGRGVGSCSALLFESM